MRKLCWWAIPCSAAIFLAVYLIPEALFIPAGFFCAGGGLLSLFLHGNSRKRVALAALGLAAGFLWTGFYQLQVRSPARALISNQAREYTLTVADFPKETSRGASFTARLQLDDFRCAKVQVYADGNAVGFRPGDRVSGPIRLAASDLLRGESTDYYQSRGIFLIGYARGELSLTDRAFGPFPRYLPQYAAQGLKTLIVRIFPSDVSGFMTALITGDKSLLPYGVYADFQRSGISHVIAVSGLHISFLAGLIALLLGKRSPFSAVIAITCMFFFAAAAGNTPSALRAAFMSSLLLLAPLVGREPDKPTTLSAALLAVLLPCPFAAASVSLQLSFGAVAGIYLITGELTARWLKRIPKWDGLPGRLAHSGLAFLLCNLAVTVGALLFTTPLAALYFGRVSLAGPVTNLLTLWAVSVTFLGGLSSALLGVFSLPLGSALAGGVAFFARWVLAAAHRIAQLPFAAVSLLSGYLVLWFIMAYSFLLLWLWKRERIRPSIPISAFALTLCAALVANAWPVLTGSLTVMALDVGQGASTLFYTKGHTVLVDCGGNSGNDPGDIAADYLQALGTSHLDALILTHYHEDHAGGAMELLSRIDTSMLILPDVTPEEPVRQELLTFAEKTECEVRFLSVDSRFTCGGAVFTLYAPLGDGGANEEGLSVLCTAGDFDVLITGDMNSVVERRLVKYKSLPDIELLMVGHHGSKHSTSEELLCALKPEWAVISSGYNSYGHPAPETLERLGAAGCDIYLTKEMGTVTFTVKGEPS